MSGRTPEPSMPGSRSPRHLGGALLAMAIVIVGVGCSELRPLPVPPQEAQDAGGASGTSSVATGGAGGEGSVTSTTGVGALAATAAGTGPGTGPGTGTGTGPGTGTGTGTGGETGAGTGGETGAGGSLIGGYVAEAASTEMVQSIAPTFYRDILPILQTRCQNCHSPGKIAPFSLTTFDDAQAVATEMAATTLSLKMPPWSARSTDECQPRFGWDGDQSLSAAQIGAFQVWSLSGARAGNPDDAPPPIVPTDDVLPAVDVTLEPKAPYLAGGDADEFRCFVLDPQLAEDRYINGSRFLIGNPGIVHHILLVQDPTGVGDQKADADGGYPCFAGPEVSGAKYVAMWTAGSGSIQFPPGVGMKLEAGMKLVMQVHYHLTGAVDVLDQIGLQLHFTDTVPGYQVMLQGIGNFTALDPDGDGLQPGPDDSGPPEFFIPAGAAGHTELMRFTLPDGTPDAPIPDLLIYALMPHMHFVASGMKIDIHRPAPPGAEPVDECLIETPQWSFDWTRSYRYAAPLDDLPTLRSGDQISVRCTYDNTTRNAALREALEQAGQPGPLDVSFGETALDEMCLGVLTLLYKTPVAP